jgi:hypothetical protein
MRWRAQHSSAARAGCSTFEAAGCGASVIADAVTARGLAAATTGRVGVVTGVRLRWPGSTWRRRRWTGGWIRRGCTRLIGAGSAIAGLALLGRVAPPTKSLPTTASAST